MNNKLPLHFKHGRLIIAIRMFHVHFTHLRPSLAYQLFSSTSNLLFSSHQPFHLFTQGSFIQITTMASNTGDMSTVRLQLGDRVFTTTMDTLNASPVLAAKFSQRWNSSTASTSTDMPAARKKRKPQKIFLDANPEIFQYILDFLRQNATPMIWDPQHGFDTNKYAAIYQMARYYGLNELAEWIKQAKYNDITIQSFRDLCLTSL